ncbi:hypothetical protein BASA81_012371 [Batrachochytrium salamandrivorans]|nr:hypothetical protein BASA81_012371 [Batrachochytrium salamandrivorans]
MSTTNTKKSAAAPAQASTKKPNPPPNSSSSSSAPNNSSRPAYQANPKFPRNVKPDPAKKTADLEAIAAEIKKLRDEREQISKQMKQLRESGKGIVEEKQKLRLELAPIKEALQQARADKDAVFTKVKQFNSQLELVISEERKAKDGMGKFSTAEDIDNEIKRRERAMFDGRFTAREEKDMIRDMDKLRLSKKQLGAVQAKQDEIKQLKDSKKQVESTLAEKKAVVEEWQLKFSVARDALTLLDGKDKAGPSTQLPLLREKHDQINEQLDALDKKRQAVYDAWKQANTDFVLAEEKRRKDEHTARAEEQAKYVKDKEDQRLAREAELEKLKPWEQEIEVCDGLILALARFAGVELPATTAQPAAASDSAAFAKKEPKKSSSSFGELKPLKREVEDLAPASKKATKAKPATAATTSAPAVAAPLILDVETLESFTFIGVEAPIFAADLIKSIDAVKEKRAYFDVLPRTAKKQLLKSEPVAAAAAAMETAPAAPAQAEKTATPPPGFAKKTANGVPSVKDATLFPTLPGFRPVATAESTWGPKPTLSPSADEAVLSAEIDYDDNE